MTGAGISSELLALFPVEVLKGTFKGGGKRGSNLKGDFLIGDPFGILGPPSGLIGSMKLKISGYGEYACFSSLLPPPLDVLLGPLPGLLAPCTAEEPTVQMGAVFLAVEDTGSFKIKEAVGAFLTAGLDKFKGKVRVSVTGVPGISVFGTIEVTKTKISFAD